MSVPAPSTRSSRATRGQEPWRQQPKLRFDFKVPARFQDGIGLARGERVGNGQQGYLGPIIEGRVPYLTTTSRADFLSAFNKRVNYHDPSRVDRSIRYYSRMLIRKLVPAKLDDIVWDPEMFRSWVNQFDSEKRLRMEKAFYNQGLERLGDYSRKELFTKIEALVKDHDTVAPRVIFKGSDYYNMIAGPYFKVLMERFKGLEKVKLPEMSWQVAYRQHTPDIVSHLQSRRSKTFIEADFSANDKTQVKDVIELEIDLMRRLGAPKWFCRLHRAASSKFSVLNSRYGLSAIAENMLATGAVDTTFRNSFWNLCIFYSWAKLYKVKGAIVSVLGDDMLAGLPRRVRRASTHYERVARLAKMRAVVTCHPQLHGCHFLSKHFVPVTRGENNHVMLPFIGKVLAKFNARPNSNQAVTDDEYMAGKALSMCYEFRYCHVLRDLFVERANYHLLRSGGKYSLEGISWHIRIHSVYAGEIESMLSGACQWPDLVSKADLTLHWITLGDVSFTDVWPTCRRIVLGVSYELLDSYVASHGLGDY